MITAAKQEGQAFTCLAYTLMLPWAALVARELHIPAALLWTKPATVFDVGDVYPIGRIIKIYIMS
ncbi:hypothetical protein AAZV13_11G231400 [Glycine max]